jgi:hypothetical protein
MDMWVTTCT